MPLIFSAVELSIHALETICWSFQRPPARTGFHNLCHVTWSQAQSPSGITIAFYPGPLPAGDAQWLEQRFSRKFVEGASVALRMMADISVSAPVL